MVTRKRLAAVTSLTVAAASVTIAGSFLMNSAQAATPVVHGFATVNGTTTGGAGGTTVTVTSAAQLATEAGGTGAKTINVSGLFSGSGDIVVTSNKTIRGVGANSGLVGLGLVIKGQTNVIIQNMNISKVTAASGNGDGIHVELSDHLWIDHNTLSGDLDHDKDFYDGLLDITHAADYITVSYNYFHNQAKASLVGHSDSNAAEDTGKFHITYDHNYFHNFGSRTPSLRFGTGHVYNNYMINDTQGGTGVHSRMSAQTLVQNNVFSNMSNPIVTTDEGAVNESGNDFGAGKNKIEKYGTLTSVPYSAPLDATSSVVSIVTAGAGAGKI